MLNFFSCFIAKERFWPTNPLQPTNLGSCSNRLSRCASPKCLLVNKKMLRFSYCKKLTIETNHATRIWRFELLTMGKSIDSCKLFNLMPAKRKARSYKKPKTIMPPLSNGCLVLRFAHLESVWNFSLSLLTNPLLHLICICMLSQNSKTHQGRKKLCYRVSVTFMI